MNFLIPLFILATIPGTGTESPEKASTTDPLTYPSLYYEIQIAVLNQETDLELFFNEEVENYINLFLFERRDIFLGYFVKSEEFFPLFEKFLKEYHLPEEIKYLPVLESGLSPYAVSPSEAVGLWQFKEPTGRAYGLEINSFVDERTDPELSTIAACKYLNRLFSEFNNWNLSLLAYNAGPTTIRNARNKAGKPDDYTSIQPYLTIPAQKYLPALVAIIYLFHNSQSHFTF